MERTHLRPRSPGWAHGSAPTEVLTLAGEDTGGRALREKCLRLRAEASGKGFFIILQGEIIGCESVFPCYR